MEVRPKNLTKPGTDKKEDAFDLDALLHPAKAFEHPMAVVRDPDLTLNEKRAILSSWASDACAIEAAPALRANPAPHDVLQRPVGQYIGTMPTTQANIPISDSRFGKKSAIHHGALAGQSTIDGWLPAK